MDIIAKRPNLLFLIAIRKLPEYEWFQSIMPNGGLERLLVGPDMYYKICMITPLCRDIYRKKLINVLKN